MRYQGLRTALSAVIVSVCSFFFLSQRAVGASVSTPPPAARGTIAPLAAPVDGYTVKDIVGAHGRSSSAESSVISPGHAFKRTYTADEGYVIAAVYAGGVLCEDARFKTTYDFTFYPNNHTDVYVLFVKKDTWWVDTNGAGGPSVAQRIEFHGSEPGNGAPFNSSISENGTYYATPTYVTGEPAYVFKTEEVLAGDLSEKLVLQPNLVAGASNRGAAVSEVLGIALFGTDSEEGVAIAVDLTATTDTLAEGVNYFRIENDKGVSFGCMQFSPDGKYLFTDAPKGIPAGSSDTCIYKWKVENNLRASGVNLRFVAAWDVYDQVQQLAYANVNGKDLLYFISSGGFVYVYDTVAGEDDFDNPYILYEGDDFSEYGDYGGAFALSGFSLGTPYLTVVPADLSRPIAVFGLAPDGLSVVEGTPVIEFDSQVTSSWNNGAPWHRHGAVPAMALSVQEDGSIAYLGGFPEEHGACTYVLTAPRPSYAITQTVGAHGSSSGPGNATIAVGTAFSRTYTADDGYVIAALYVDGKHVADAQFQPSYDLSIVPRADATVSVLFAKKGAWWVDDLGLGAPLLASRIGYGAGGGSGGPYSSGLSENGLYYATPTYMTGESAYVFRTSDVFLGDTTSRLVLPDDLVPGASNRGSAISEKLGVAIFGTAAAADGAAVAVDLMATTEALKMNENYFRIANDQGISFGCMRFSSDSVHLYTDCYKGGEGNHYIYKFLVQNGLRSSDVNLQFSDKWNVGARVRQIDLARIGGKELIYYISDGGLFGVLDTSTGVSKALRPADGNGGNYSAIAVSGVADGTPHLTIVPCVNTLPIEVYGLSDDGLSLVSARPVVSFPPSVASGWNGGNAWHRDGNTFCTAVNVADDESTAYIGAYPSVGGATTYVVKAARPSPVVRQVVGAHGSSPDVAEETLAPYRPCTRRYTADEGYVISALFVNGIPVPAARFETTFVHAFVPDGDTTVSVLFAKKGTWWVDDDGTGSPVVVARIPFGNGGSGGPYSSGLSESGAYYTTPTYMTGEPAYVFRSADLLQLDTTSRLVVPPNLVQGGSNRGSDVSEALGIALFGTALPGGSAVAVDVTATTETLQEGANYFRIANDKDVSFGCMRFDAEGAYLYTDCYKGGAGNHFVYKWKIEKGLRESGVCLTYVAHWDAGARVRQMDLARIGGKEIVYFISDGGLFGLLDTSTGAATILHPAIMSGDYGAIAVAGIADGTPHLTVVPSDGTAPIAVYGLAPDGLSLVSPHPVVTFEPSVTSAWNGGKSWHRSGGNWCTGVNVTDDATVAYIGGFPESGACTYVLMARMPKVKMSEAIQGGGGAASGSLFEVDLGSSYAARYDAPSWTRIASITINGVPIAEAAGRVSYDLSIPSVVSRTEISVTFGIPTGGVNGYTVAQARWFLDNGIPEDKTRGDDDGDGLTAEAECLLGLSSFDTDTVDFAISSIMVGDQVVVEVKLVRASAGTPVTGPVLGTLVLQGAPAIDRPFQALEAQSIAGAFDGKEVETFTFPASGATFFRAVIEK